MDKNNSSSLSSSSSSSVCMKIRHALSSNPAFKAVQRITSFNQEQEPNKPITKNPNSPSSSNITDINEHFKEFIENTKEKMMRSVTNIGKWVHSNHHFIQRVRKKLRTTTTVRKSGSLREKLHKYASMGLTVFGAYLIAKHAIRYWRPSEIPKRVLAAAAEKSGQNNDVEKADSLSDSAERDRSLCVICLEHEYNAVFVPCGHMCCCTTCSSHLTNCPLCRRQIEKVLKTFLIEY